MKFIAGSKQEHDDRESSCPGATTDAVCKYARVVAAFAANPAVARSLQKGFGAGALKTGGKIFAMLSRTGKFVVKLPKTRVGWLVAEGIGERFDPVHGRPMQEWLAVKSTGVDWNALAAEALAYATLREATPVRTEKRPRRPSR